MMLAGKDSHDIDERGRPLHDDNLLLLLNASTMDLEFAVPAFDQVWELLVHTADDGAGERIDPGGVTRLIARPLKLFRCAA